MTEVNSQGQILLGIKAEVLTEQFKYAVDLFSFDLLARKSRRNQRLKIFRYALVTKPTTKTCIGEKCT